jgi:predicted outer membrane repeat protein
MRMSRRNPLPLLLPLALAVLGGCQDQPLPTALAPEEAVFGHQAGTCVVSNILDDGEGSLRHAIATPECSEITFSVTGTITLASTLTIESERHVTITGPGAASLSVSGNGSVRVFLIAPEAVVGISGITITGGRSEADGGGIHNTGTLILSQITISGNSSRQLGGGILSSGSLTLSNSAVSANATSGGGIGAGGGIYNKGTLAVSNSIISGNDSDGTAGAGGGIYNEFSWTVTTTNSTVSGNSGKLGGGIYNEGALTLTNSTVSGNDAVEVGGIYSAGSLTLTNSTVSGNTAEYTVGGIYNEEGPLALTHSTVANNIGGGIANWQDGTLALRSSLVAGNGGIFPLDIADWTLSMDASHSLIGSSSGHLITHGSGGNIVGVAADALLLGPLAGNGGATQTHALLAGSPGIDAGDPDFSDPALPYDQRGSGFARVSGGRIDIGAFEVQQAAGFTFTGFFAPVENLPTVNVARAGSGIPVKFSLGGNQGLSIFASGSPGSQQITCDASAPQGPIEETVNAGGSSLSYDAAMDRYTYVWKTDRGWGGTCRTLTLTFTDGTTRAASFRFTR